MVKQDRTLVVLICVMLITQAAIEGSHLALIGAVIGWGNTLRSAPSNNWCGVWKPHFLCGLSPAYEGDKPLGFVATSFCPYWQTKAAALLGIGSEPAVLVLNEMNCGAVLNNQQRKRCMIRYHAESLGFVETEFHTAESSGIFLFFKILPMCVAPLKWGVPPKDSVELMIGKSLFEELCFPMGRPGGDYTLSSRDEKGGSTLKNQTKRLVFWSTVLGEPLSRVYGNISSFSQVLIRSLALCIELPLLSSSLWEAQRWVRKNVCRPLWLRILPEEFSVICLVSISRFSKRIQVFHSGSLRPCDVTIKGCYRPFHIG